MIIEKWAEHLTSIKYEDLDREAVRWAKLRILDVLGCIAAGAFAEGNEKLVEIVKDWGGRPESTIFMFGIKVPLINAAMVNCIFARSFDFGPVHPEYEGKGVPGHISETSIPSALSIGEALRADGKRILTSLVLGEDIACRLLVASDFDLSQGWDCIGTVNAFAVTALYGYLFGLKEKEIRNAFGILLSLIGGSIQSVWDGSTSFKLIQGLPARNGIFAVQLAKASWTGPKDPLFSRFGYFKLFSSGKIQEEILTKDLGKKFYTDSVIKPYSSCRGTHGFIDCAITVQKKYGLKKEEIEEVVLIFPKGGLSSFVAKPFEIEDFPQANAIFSAQYTVASTFLRGPFSPLHLKETAIKDEEVVRFAKKIKMEESPEIKSAGIRVKTRDGREFFESITVPRGDRKGNPLSEAEIKGKFMENLAFAKKGLERKGERIIEIVENFEEIKDTEELVRFFS